MGGRHDDTQRTRQPPAILPRRPSAAARAKHKVREHTSENQRGMPSGKKHTGEKQSKEIKSRCEVKRAYILQSEGKRKEVCAARVLETGV